MLLLEPFGDRRFSVAMPAVALAVFALMGSLFVLTQYLQFSLGFSAFGAGLRILPIAVVLAVAAPASSYLDRWLGTKVVIGTGLVLVACGLAQLTTTTTAEGFGHALIGMVLLGLGAGLIIAPGTASVMGSLPRDRAGAGAAMNGTALQVGGALGVAVLGSVLSSRYQSKMAPVLSAHAVPAVAAHAISSGIGGALAVARIAGGELGAELADAARAAFVTGMDAALLVGAVVVAASAVLVLVALPARRRPQGRLASDPDPSPSSGRSALDLSRDWPRAGARGARQRCGCAPGERTRRNAVKVRDALHKAPVTVSPRASLAETATVMAEYNVGAVLVVEGDSLVGIVTDRDLVVRALASGQAAGEEVGSVMTLEPSTVQGGAEVDEALAVLAEGGFRRVPVLEDDQLAGMLTTDDVLAAALALLGAAVAPVLGERD